MQKLTLLTIVLLMTAVTNLKAQTLQNTSWKMWIGELNDTLTIHIGKDSSFVTDGAGEVVVRSVWKVTKDTVSLLDYEGKYACLNDKGIYKVGVTNDVMTFALISDPCEGRVNSLDGSKWIKAAK